MAVSSLPASPHIGMESYQVNLPKGDSSQPILMFEGSLWCQEMKKEKKRKKKAW